MPRADFNPIRRIDEELAKLREAQTRICAEKRRYRICVEVGSFRADSIQLHVDCDRLSVVCEEEVPICANTSVLKRFVRRVNAPMAQLRADLIATEVSERIEAQLFSCMHQVY